MREIILDREYLEKKFQQPSFWYNIVNNIVVKPAHRKFYRKIHILHSERLPLSGPVIYVMNHGNALMDAMAIVCFQHRQTVFVARADIFKHPIIRKILFFFRIMPIFRKRDGGSSKENNQETFDVVQHILSTGNAFAMMPEGNHGEYRRLRPLQKGVFRIAMDAQQIYKENPGIKIIPVGINYQHSRKVYKDITVVFGDPIEMNKYYAGYTENAAKTMLLMQEELALAMKQNIIHIEDEEFYKEIDNCSSFFAKDICAYSNGNINDAESLLLAQQHIAAGMSIVAEKDHAKMQDIALKTKAYSELLKTLNLHNNTVYTEYFPKHKLILSAIVLIALLPLYAFSFLMNFVPFCLSEKMTTSIKDPQFVNSIRFVVGMLAYPIFHWILAILFILFLPMLTIPTLVFLYFSKQFWLWYDNFFKRIKGEWKFACLDTNKKENILKTRKDLLNAITN